MGWQLVAQGLIVHIGVHIGQHGAFWGEFFDPLQRFCQAKMRRMRRYAQRIDNPDIEIAQRNDALFRNRIHIRCIGQIIDAKTQRWNGTVLELKWQKTDRTTLA